MIDPKREELLVKEANRLKIPVVALTDTNCDPDVVDYVIPGNDDAIRSIYLISRLIADSILEGRGEDVTPADDRPLPPVVEEALVNEEVEAAKASTNGNGAAVAPVEPEAETPAVTTEPATADAPPNGAQSAAEPVAETADEVAADEPVRDPAEEPVAEEPSTDEPAVEEAEEESSEEASAEAGQANEQNEES